MNNRVQLLPSEYKKRIEEKRQMNKILKAMSFVALIALVSLVLTTGVNLFNKARISSLENDKLALQSQIEVYKKYEDMDKEAQALQVKIDSAKANGGRYINMVGEISDLIPGGIWIENTTMTGPDVTLACAGNSYEDVAKTVEKLSASPYLGNVYCQGSTENNGVVKFTISATIL